MAKGLFCDLNFFLLQSHKKNRHSAVNEFHVGDVIGNNNNNVNNTNNRQQTSLIISPPTNIPSSTTNVLNLNLSDNHVLKNNLD